MVGEKMKDTDKVYNVKVIPDIEDNILLRVPKGVEINRNILVKSGELCITKNVDISFTEVDKELWNEEEKVLDNRGSIGRFENLENDDKKVVKSSPSIPVYKEQD